MTDFKDLADSLDEQAKQKAQQDQKAAESAASAQNADKIVASVNQNAQSTAEGLKHVKGEVSVTNPTDVSGVIDSIHKLNLTAFMQNEGLPQLANNLSDLSNKTQDLQEKLENEGLKKMSDQLSLVVKKLDEVGKVISKTEVSVDAKLQKTIDNLSKSINAIDFKPAVNVTSPATKVVTTPIDLKPVIAALSKVEKAISSAEAPDNTINLAPVIDGLSTVQKAIQALRFPAPNYVLPFRSIDGKAVQVQLDASGNLPTAGGGGGSGTQYTQGGATVANPTGTAEMWFDGSGNPKAVTPAQPLPSNLTDGTNVTNILKSDGSAAGQNSQITAGTYLSLAYTTTTVQAVAATDVGNYSYVSVQINSQGTNSTITFQGSNDNSTWVSVALSQPAGVTQAPASGSTGTGIFAGPLNFRYFRLNITGISAGTTAGTIIFSTLSRISLSPGGAPTVGSNAATGSAVPANAFYIAAKSGANLTGLLMGSQTTANSLGVALATDQVAIPVTESGTWNVGASTATGSAVPANAMYAGVNAQTALPTAASAGNLTGATADKFGRSVVLPGTIRDLVGTQTTTISASTAETTIVTAAASVFNDLTALVVSNTSATAARLDFRDTTLGSILFSLYVPAGDVRGVAFNRPIPQTSVNTNWTAQSSASVTDLRVYAVFDKNK